VKTTIESRPRARRATVLLAAVAALAGAGIAAQPASAAPRMEVAIQDDAVFLHPQFPYSITKGYQQAKALGTKWVRFNILWADYKASCKKNGNSRCFQPWDDAVDTARRNGVSVQMTIAGTPQYEPDGDKWLSYNRPKAARYKIFVTLVAKHFKGRVFRYSLWDEPNLPRWITPRSQAPKIYRALVLAGYSAIKRVDRRAAVLIGEFTSANDPLAFMEQMGRGIKADGLAYHPFEFFVEPGKRIIRTRPRRVSGFIGINSTPWIQSTLRTLARQKRISTPRGGALPLHYTEFGYQTEGRYRISQAKRKVWALKAMRLVARFKVKQMLWYQLVHNPNSFGDVWDSGLVSMAGVPDATYTNLQRNRRSYAGF
jgi:hypothetical protein